MNKDELNVTFFRQELNKQYSVLSWSIKRDKKFIRHNLAEVLRVISRNIEYLDYLPQEELYMALNVIKLARSQGYEKYKHLYESEIFIKLDESYANSRQNR